jgi:hypothetical protein
MDVEANKLRAGLGTSGESAKASQPLALRLREVIIDLARQAGPTGITINEGERLIPDHKGHSVSSRFSELVERGDLVRVFVGYGQPAKRFPKGVPRYVTRYDEETGRNVVVHWLPEFAPKVVQGRGATDCRPPEKHKPQSVRLESRKRKGELV